MDIVRNFADSCIEWKVSTIVLVLLLGIILCIFTIYCMFTCCTSALCCAIPLRKRVSRREVEEYEVEMDMMGDDVRGRNHGEEL